jgi:enediyne biosynthesis protein E4
VILQYLKVIGLAFAGLLLVGGAAGAEGGRLPRFVDVAVEAGVDFVHHNGPSPEKRLPETNGAGCAFFDYDGDGDQDLYLVDSGDMVKGRQGADNVLLRNDGGHFVDITAQARAEGGGYGKGVLAGDYDGDGDQDLYLSNWGPDLLLRQEADGTFVEVAGQSGVANPDWGTSAVYLDYDMDGDLDLFVVNYVHFRLGEQPWCGRADLGMRFYCDPRQFAPSLDRLFQNQGDGTFVDVSAAAGIDQPGNGLGAVSADFDHNGWPDLYVANDLTSNLMYMNRKGAFSEDGLLSGAAFSNDGAAQAGMGVDAGDFDGDGDEDIFVTNYQLENNNLYRNDGDFFWDHSAEAGIAKRSLDYLGFGAFFFDYDNDGWLDLFVANGHVHDNIGAYDSIVTYAQRPQLFHNQGQGTFEEQTDSAGPAFAASYVGRGAAYADYDLDGDLDIALTASGERTALMRNDGGNQGNWIEVRLQGAGANRDAVGARVVMRLDGTEQWRTVRAGSSFLSTSQKALLFGLGAAPRAASLQVYWPSGATQTLEGIAAGQRLLLQEGAAEDTTSNQTESGGTQ